MVSAKTPAKPKLELLELNPNDLVLPLDGNIRKDTRLDPDFLASIKSRGVLIPVMVYSNEDGGYDVFDGQRRTLAAVQAGHTTIWTIVTASRADAERISDQLIANDHRANLSDVEHVAAYQQLALFGMSASAISKRTSTPSDRVTMALTVANNEIASDALQSYPITLEQADAIAELSGDAAAVKSLIDVAAKEPERFEHILADQRKRVALETDQAAHRTQLELDGITYLGARETYMRSFKKDDVEWIRIEYLALAASPTVELTFNDIRGFGADAGGTVTSDYARTEPEFYAKIAKTTYWVANPEGHGLVDKEHERPVRDLTPEEAEAAAERQREQDAIAKSREEWTQAATIRKAWISEFLERPNPPSDAIIYIAWARTFEYYSFEITTEMLGWLGIAVIDEQDEYDAVRDALKARPKLAMPFVLAYALGTLEELTHAAQKAYNKDELIEAVTFHLNQLRAWGYGLSDAEQNYISDAEQTLALAEASGTDGDSDDDGWEDPTESEDD